jgi:hypothetical protein
MQVPARRYSASRLLGELDVPEYLLEIRLECSARAVGWVFGFGVKIIRDVRGTGSRPHFRAWNLESPA